MHCEQQTSELGSVLFVCMCDAEGEGEVWGEGYEM